MNRYLRLLLCLPPLAATACTAEGIAGPRLAPAPNANAQAASAPSIVYQGCIVPPERAGGEPLYVVDGVILVSLPELDPTDIASVKVIKHLTETQTDPRARSVVIITTHSAARRRERARP